LCPTHLQLALLDPQVLRKIGSVAARPLGILAADENAESAYAVGMADRQRLIAWTDGGGGSSTPDPEAYIGVLVVDEVTGKDLLRHAQCIGRTTHNVAEYTAVLTAVRFAVEAGAQSLHIRTDSALVVNQINGRFRVTKPHLAALLEEVREAAKPLDLKIEWVSRDKNAEADALTWTVRRLFAAANPSQSSPAAEAVAEVFAPAPPVKSPRKRKAAAWRSLPPAELAAHLLATLTITDSAWTTEPRLPRENRGSFIRRIVLGETPESATEEP
jgi:ribonuclease HI